MSPSGAAVAATAVCLPVRLSMCLIIHKRGSAYCASVMGHDTEGEAGITCGTGSN